MKHKESFYRCIIESQIKQIDTLTDMVADYKTRLNNSVDFTNDLIKQIRELEKRSSKTSKHAKDSWDSLVDALVNGIMEMMDDDEDDED